MASFYADIMKMKPEAKLGQVIKQEKIETSVKDEQACKIAYVSSDVAGHKTIFTGLIMCEWLTQKLSIIDHPT